MVPLQGSLFAKACRICNLLGTVENSKEYSHPRRSVGDHGSGQRCLLATARRFKGRGLLGGHACRRTAQARS
ncbi:unnamed protein product [Periconia digitata]|uniref:Uncharacterized protein n=1 Tax=Periconia digitata TaxID=1303443 RepID=A0A9W4UM20_9PLEO|nr:unnamed protein product [Periconia digitata]